MFLGQYRHSLDSKKRLTIPSGFREELGAAAVILQGFDGNLMVYPVQAFERMAQASDTLNETDPETRLLKRMLFATAVGVEVDKAGRILVPEFLCEHANLTNDVYLTGARDHFDIWSVEKWQEQMALLKDPGVATRFTSLRIAPVSG